MGVTGADGQSPAGLCWRYRLEQVLGRGGMGWCGGGRHAIERTVAIKELRGPAGATEEERPPSSSGRCGRR